MNIVKKYEWLSKNLVKNQVTENPTRIFVITKGDINILKRDCPNKGKAMINGKELDVVEIAGKDYALDCDQVQIDGICRYVECD